MPAPKAIEATARWLAISGGFALLAIVLITIASVAGRNLIPLGLGPVPGDFELVEAASAYAIFAFLPWCHLQRAHVRVDILADALGARSNRLIDALCDSLMLILAAVICWRHFAGLMDKRAVGETTFILQFPVWWSYAASLIGAIAFVAISVYCCQRSWRRLLGGLDDTRGQSGNGDAR